MLRPKSVAQQQHANDDDLEKIIHEEIDRLPGVFRVAMVLCDLEGRTHEQAVRIRDAPSERSRAASPGEGKGCAVGSCVGAWHSACAGGRVRRRRRSSGSADRFGRVDGRLRGNGERRSSIGRCHYRRSPEIHVPEQGQIRVDGHSGRGSARGRCRRLAQSGIGRPKDGTGKAQHVGSPSYTYHILVSRNGEPPRKVAVVEMTGDTPISVDAPGALILFQPKARPRARPPDCRGKTSRGQPSRGHGREERPGTP